MGRAWIASSERGGPLGCGARRSALADSSRSVIRRWRDLAMHEAPRRDHASPPRSRLGPGRSLLRPRAPGQSALLVRRARPESRSADRSRLQAPRRGDRRADASARGSAARGAWGYRGGSLSSWAASACGWMFRWGLVANLTGFALLLFALPALERFVRRATWRGALGVCAYTGVLFGCSTSLRRSCSRSRAERSRSSVLPAGEDSRRASRPCSSWPRWRLRSGT